MLSKLLMLKHKNNIAKKLNLFPIYKSLWAITDCKYIVLPALNHLLFFPSGDRSAHSCLKAQSHGDTTVEYKRWDSNSKLIDIPENALSVTYKNTTIGDQTYWIPIRRWQSNFVFWLYRQGNIWDWYLWREIR